MIGNEDVIQIDTTRPEQAKRLKSAKAPGMDFSGSFCQQGEEFIVDGWMIRADDIRVVTLHHGKPPTVLKKQKLENFEAKALGSESSRGLVLREGTLLVFTYHRGLDTFRVDRTPR